MLKSFKRLEFDGEWVVLGNLGSLGYDTSVHVDDLTIVSDITYKFGDSVVMLDSEPEDVYNHYQTYKRIRYAKERFKGNGKSFQEFPRVY